MSRQCYGCIVIAGRLRREDIPRLCAALGLPREEFEARLDEVGSCWTHEDAVAAYGQFGVLERLCQELDLSYFRHSAGSDTFAPELAWWQPGMELPVTVPADPDGYPMVTMDRVVAIRDALRKGRMADALQLAEAAVVVVPRLPPLEIA